jgi:TolA-binding protein
MGEVLIVMICVGLPVSIPIIAIWTGHQRQMAEIKARAGNIQGSGVLDELRQQIGALREDLAQLRETSTRFDISVDAALERVEQRLDHVEQTGASVGARTTAYPTTAPAVPDAERVVLGQRGS